MDIRRVVAQDIVRKVRGRWGELWLAGPPLPGGTPRVAVVGTREPMPEEVAFAQELGRTLSEAGAVVVSGGAVGIDTAALHGALQGGGRPVAVPGSGLHQLYPAVNADLYTAIVAAGGHLLSPFPPEQGALRGSFPRRNGLIVDLVDALIAVVGGVDSGTCKCARVAWRANVPVFTVPWSPVEPRNAGTDALRHRGALLIKSMADAQALVADLRAGRYNHWSLRAKRPWPEKRRAPRAPCLPFASPAEVIDGACGAPPCYPSEAVTAAACPAAFADGPAFAGDHALAERVWAALASAGAEGVVLEALAAETGIERGRLAAATLQLVMDGMILRAPGGVLRLRHAG